MVPVQPGCRRESDEELTAVGVRSTVRHAQNSSAGVFKLSANLILKFLAVDGAASSTGASGIASLDHEVRNDAMEDDIVVVATFSEGCKVLACLKRKTLVRTL